MIVAKLHVVGSINDYTINAGGYRLGNLMDPGINTDAETKGYVDSVASVIAPGGASSTWTVSGNDIYNSNSGNVGILACLFEKN